MKLILTALIILYGIISPTMAQSPQNSLNALMKLNQTQSKFNTNTNQVKQIQETNTHPSQKKVIPISKIERYFYDREQHLKPKTQSFYVSTNAFIEQKKNKENKEKKINFSTQLVENQQQNQNNKNNPENFNLLEKKIPSKNNSLTTLKNTLVTKNIVRQFGYDIFMNNNPNPTDLSQIPVGPDYTLGPGDQLSIRIWGKLEEVFEVTIDQKGRIYIPKIGHISLSGISLGKSTPLIKSALSKHYINFDISVSINSLKTIKVFILGDVKHPGAYDISSLSTAFTALFHAGGPTKEGSLRQIKLKRHNKTVKTIDLYHYLLQGDKNQDIQLNTLDTLFIPPIGDVVKIDGPIKRPGIFELNKNNNAKHVLSEFAGGFSIGASGHHIRIDKDSPNNPLTFIDISSQSQVHTLRKLKKIQLTNGDRIQIIKKTDIQTNRIHLNGQVFYPGQYGHTDQLTLKDLITKAGGLKKSAYSKQIEIFRFVSDDQKKVIFVDLETNPTFEVHPWDDINIPSYTDIFGKTHVYIEGAVQKPGQYQLFDQMTLKDIIRLARPTPESILDSIEVHRKNNTSKEDILTFSSSDLEKKTIQLQNRDHILIKTNGALTQLKHIKIEGEVKYPGTYIATEGERLSSLIKRAGGYTEDAFLEGAIFTRKNIKQNEANGHQRVLEEEKKRLVFDQRKSEAISTDYQVIYATAISFLEKKIEDSKGRMIIKLAPLPQLEKSNYDITLEDGDILIIPEQPETIQVVGGIQQPMAILYQKRNKPKHYIRQAGSYTEFARKNKHYLLKANGTVKINGNKVAAGDTIYVPEKVKVYTNWLEIATKITTLVVQTLTSLVITGIIDP